MVFSITLILVACTGIVSAQLSDIFGLSDSCNKALGGLIIGSPAANCLNTAGLLNVLTTPSGQSWVPPLDSYLKTTCSQPACTNDTISTAISSLKDGCASDLASKGWSADNIATTLGNASGYYPSVREVMCLRDTGNQQLCITTTLNNEEATLGQPINIGTFVANLPTILSTHTINLPKNISCTPCTQGAYTIARPNLPSDASVKAWDTFWINQCGESFISGTLPTSIAQTANTTTESTLPEPSSNAALVTKIPSLGAVVGSLALISGTMLAVLARG